MVRTEISLFLQNVFPGSWASSPVCCPAPASTSTRSPSDRPHHSPGKRPGVPDGRECRRSWPRRPSIPRSENGPARRPSRGTRKSCAAAGCRIPRLIRSWACKGVIRPATGRSAAAGEGGCRTQVFSTGTSVSSGVASRSRTQGGFRNGNVFRHIHFDRPKRRLDNADSEAVFQCPQLFQFLPHLQ